MTNKKTTTELKVLKSKKVINSINKQLAPILENKFGIILVQGEFITNFTRINYYSISDGFIFDCFVHFKNKNMNFLHNCILQSLQGSEFIRGKENSYFKMPVFLKAFDNLNDSVIIYLGYFNIFVYANKKVTVTYGNNLKNQRYWKNLKINKDRKISFDLFR